MTARGAAPPPVLEAHDLVKEYRRGRVVDGVRLTVREGERVGLLGPNGAGKTTTLLMCLGAVAPDAGSVHVLGHRLPAGRPAAMRGVGFAAGYLPLPDRLRVREYLRLYADLYGLRAPRAAVETALEHFGIGHLATAIGTELSSGQRTLVGIAKASLHTPRLLVLDEPTAALDPDIALRVRTGLLDLCARHGTALLVTSHDMVEVERLCERVVFLAAGRVTADGTPQEVARQFEQRDLEGVFLHLAEARDRERARDGAGAGTETGAGAGTDVRTGAAEREGAGAA
ncbi:ABC transporter ATP-binding protein [Streptomyces monomycini]|uniref:ABC transporter ATP-binding protein n=1 Tax=Streptomyces monomycini TaxID=371720 RepID=UPI00067E306D|nr:ABC transporter ATP-binding protein [Streptomyces monomycini]